MQQWQVDPGLHALEAFGRLYVDLDDPPIGQDQLRALMAGVDPFLFAAAENQPLAVHDVHVVGQDRHGTVDDILREVMVQFEHGGWILGLDCSVAQGTPANPVRRHKDSGAGVAETHRASHVTLASQKIIIKRDRHVTERRVAPGHR